MRLGLVWAPSPGANYRAIGPLKEMARRGHEVVWPLDREGKADPRLLARCDVVHVYRRWDEETRQVLAQLIRRGAAVTYDNDDDLAALPRESPSYEKWGGLAGQRLFAETVKTARMAHCFTTTTELLAERYANAGVERAEVIRNYLALDCAEPIVRQDAVVVGWKPLSRPLRPPRQSHDGIVIGWIAGREHEADVAQIEIAAALRRLVAVRQEVRIECIGVDIGLPKRYRHDSSVPFEELPGRIAGFDIGIAPLADIPFNRVRSDIKLKEYAGSGVPWLASPVGPYVGLGEEEGGHLVADDGWFQALDWLVSCRDHRERLGRNAGRWALSQMIDANASRWEEVFAQAATCTRGPALRATPKMTVRLVARPPSR